MSPEELMAIERAHHRLDEEYWNGSDASFTDALNELADLVENARNAWMNGKARR